MLKKLPKPVRYGIIIFLVGFAAWAIIPVFIDREVNETKPENAQTVTSAAPIQQDAEQSDTEQQQESPRERVSTFAGRNGYSAEGTVRIIEDEDGKRYVRFDDDFSTSNGPDLRVFIGTADERGTDLGGLRGNIGSQNYELPAELDVTTVDTVRVWCRAFSADFAIATL